MIDCNAHSCNIICLWWIIVTTSAPAPSSNYGAPAPVYGVPTPAAYQSPPPSNPPITVSIVGHGPVPNYLPIPGPPTPTLVTNHGASGYRQQITQTYGPPQQAQRPQQAYGPPQQVYGPPQQTYEPPQQAYGPPQQIYNVSRHFCDIVISSSSFRLRMKYWSSRCSRIEQPHRIRLAC